MSLTGAPEGWSCLCHICSGCCWCQEGLGLSSQSSSTWSCIRGKATLRKLFLWSPALQSPGPQLCLLVQSLITHLRALHPCTAGKAKRRQDGTEMSQAAAELSTAPWSLLPPGRTTFLSCSTDTRDSSNPGTKLPSLNPSKLKCQLVMEQYNVMPRREIVSLK